MLFQRQLQKHFPAQHYAIEIANKGIDKAAAENNTILTGINTHQGDLTSKAVADSLDLPFTPYKG